jgi:tellurite resistance protein
MTAEIEVTRKLQRERRALVDAVEDTQTALENAQQQMRDISEHFTDPTHAGGIDELTVAHANVKAASSVLDAAKQELESFDREHGNLPAKQAELTREQEEQIRQEFKQALRGALKLLKELKDNERCRAALRDKAAVYDRPVTLPWGGVSPSNDLVGIPKNLLQSFVPPGMWCNPGAPANIGGLYRDLVKRVAEWAPELLDVVDDEMLAECNIKRPVEDKQEQDS